MTDHLQVRLNAANETGALQDMRQGDMGGGQETLTKAKSQREKREITAEHRAAPGNYCSGEAHKHDTAAA